MNTLLQNLPTLILVVFGLLILWRVYTLLRRPQHPRAILGSALSITSSLVVLSLAGATGGNLWWVFWALLVASLVAVALATHQASAATSLPAPPGRGSFILEAITAALLLVLAAAAVIGPLL